MDSAKKDESLAVGQAQWTVKIGRLANLLETTNDPLQVIDAFCEEEKERPRLLIDSVSR